MADAKSKIAARARARYEREKILYDEKMARRAEREASGQKRLGKAPKAPDPAPKVQDQINLTDEESRIMPVSGGGFEQSYNAQAAVDDQSMLVVATGVSQAPNDKEQVLPMLETLQAQAAALGPIVPNVLDELPKLIPADFPASVSELIFEGIRRQALRLAAMAES